MFSPPFFTPALPFSVFTLALLLGACSPTVRIEAPEKPIEINMTLNI